jgi:hypothetical protein
LTSALHFIFSKFKRSLGEICCWRSTEWSKFSACRSFSKAIQVHSSSFRDSFDCDQVLFFIHQWDHFGDDKASVSMTWAGSSVNHSLALNFWVVSLSFYPSFHFRCFKIYYCRIMTIWNYYLFFLTVKFVIWVRYSHF